MESQDELYAHTSLNPPRRLGALVAAFGAASALGGLSTAASAAGIDWYYLIMGLGYAIAGVLLYRGSTAGPACCGLTMLFVWVWSVAETRSGVLTKQLVMQLGMPTLVSLYCLSSGVRSRLGPEAGAVRRLPPIGARQARRIDRAVERIAAVGGWLPRLLLWVVLAGGMKGALDHFLGTPHISAAAWLYLPWILTPYPLLASIPLVAGRDVMREFVLLFGGIALALLGMAAYGANLSPSDRLEDTWVFLWVPATQLVWVGVCLYRFRAGIGGGERGFDGRGEGA